MSEKTDITSDAAAAAAIVSAGVGCFVTGLLTAGAEMSVGLKTALTWSGPVGPLSGKTCVGVIAWLIAWLVLHFAWRQKDVNFRTMYIVTLVLLAFGFLLTFPIFFQAFAGE